MPAALLAAGSSTLNHRHTMKDEVTTNLLAEYRDMLKALSQEVYDFVESGTFPTVNEALMEIMYKDGPHWEFKSFRQWRKEGFMVKAGEKPFLLWGKPKDIELLEESEIAPKFFPLVYLFSNAQVEPMTSETEEPEPAPQEPELEPLPYG
jgi:hypothetical protein